MRQFSEMLQCDNVETNGYEWVWDPLRATASIVLRNENKEVCFHPIYSTGTAAVRGSKPFVVGHDYYWEVEMLTAPYGTDVMIGVGTSKVNLEKYVSEFSSLLGADKESWGLSYDGGLWHNGRVRRYGKGFKEGSLIGVRVDMWRGTLTFYLDRQPLGVASTSLKGSVYYPMVCSTAAQSSMRIVCASSCTSCLQLLCLESLSSHCNSVKKLLTIPGLQIYAKQAFWLLYCSDDSGNESKENDMEIVANRQYRQGVANRDSETCLLCKADEREVCANTRNSSKRLCFVCDTIF